MLRFFSAVLLLDFSISSLSATPLKHFKPAKATGVKDLKLSCQSKV